MIEKASVEWKRGHWGERAARNLLKQGGWWVLNTGDIHNDHGGAPMFEGLNAKLVAADIDGVTPAGERRFVEVKTRSYWFFFDKRQQFQTGMDRYCYDNYIALEKRFGTPVDIAFVVLRRSKLAPVEPILYLQALAVLKTCVDFGTWPNLKMRDGKGVYWAIDYFEEMQLREAVPADVAAMRHRIECRKSEMPSKSGHIPSTKDPLQRHFRF